MRAPPFSPPGRPPMEPAHARLAARYTRFAEEEVQGRSPLYEAICLGVAGDAAVLGFLETVPAAKRQPNLLLAAVRQVAGTPSDWPGFRTALLAQPDAVRAVMLSHATQTNEPARCAVLLPILARLPQPLALIEVGASAGLCLLPDRYGYAYGSRVLHPLGARSSYPVFPCQADAGTPVPTAIPRVVWRAGLDLAPIDATDPLQAAWLETLVWPEQTDRLSRLRLALEIAARERPRIVQGDLLSDRLDRLCAEAPSGATLVVFHTAVLAYLADRSERERFAETVRSLCPVWISNEAPGVFPGIARAAGPTPNAGGFLLSVNGVPAAWTDPHGASMTWIGD
jgi:hypothetical protein